MFPFVTLKQVNIRWVVFTAILLIHLMPLIFRFANMFKILLSQEWRWLIFGMQMFISMSQNSKRICPEVFYKTANLKHFAKFARQHLYRRLCFDRFAVFINNFIKKTPALVLKPDAVAFIAKFRHVSSISIFLFDADFEHSFILLATRPLIIKIYSMLSLSLKASAYSGVLKCSTLH